ncbi:hypothetical protein K7X08_033985 [Anisodus acutangulus]|uniref:Uncharacterized protein n=1 Tax=Anisodus acutangulus TaxID=402998 RepID=A0A9Q1R595_9SOLA|nr:hypothetical protein K7X08_033985 [Anisodus acutangulus]
MQKYSPKVLSSGKTLTYPRNTKGEYKRKDVDKDVGVTDDVTVEPVHNKEIEEKDIVDTEGRIDNNVEVNEFNNDHEANEVIIKQQLQESMGHKRVFTENGNNTEDHDKNQELFFLDVQLNGAAPIEDMDKTELHSITSEPTKLVMNSTYKAPQMEDLGKGGEHEELGNTC